MRYIGDKNFKYKDELIKELRTYNLKHTDKKIVVMGHSYGTGIAACLASVRNCDSFVLMAAYRDLLDLYNKIIPIFREAFKVFLSNDIRLIDYAQNVTCNTYIIGSNSDKILNADLQYKVKDYFKRCISFGRMGLKWATFTVLFFLIMVVVGLFISVNILKMEMPGMLWVNMTIARPYIIPVFLLLSFVSGPLNEEFGWRGYSLDRLLIRFGYVKSSLLFMLLIQRSLGLLLKVSSERLRKKRRNEAISLQMMMVSIVAVRHIV